MYYDYCLAVIMIQYIVEVSPNNIVIVLVVPCITTIGLNNGLVHCRSVIEYLCIFVHYIVYCFAVLLTLSCNRRYARVFTYILRANLHSLTGWMSYVCGAEWVQAHASASFFIGQSLSRSSSLADWHSTN